MHAWKCNHKQGLEIYKAVLAPTSLSSMYTGHGIRLWSRKFFQKGLPIEFTMIMIKKKIVQEIHEFSVMTWVLPCWHVCFWLIGKVGAILASIPQALAASMLCFMWGLTVSLGLSTLQYSQTSSYRNITIVGVSLFLGLTIPAYFQQYQPESSLILPSYFVPYAAASNGPVHTSSKQVCLFSISICKIIYMSLARAFPSIFLFPLPRSWSSIFSLSVWFCNERSHVLEHGCDTCGRICARQHRPR